MRWAQPADNMPNYGREIASQVGSAVLQLNLDLPNANNWEALLPSYAHGGAAAATRKTSGAALNAVAPVITELVGGSADLTPSNNTEYAAIHTPRPAFRHFFSPC